MQEGGVPVLSQNIYINVLDQVRISRGRGDIRGGYFLEPYCENMNQRKSTQGCIRLTISGIEIYVQEISKLKILDAILNQ